MFELDAMSKIELAAKYSAIEAALGFKPAALRDFVSNAGGIEKAYFNVQIDPQLSLIGIPAYNEALETFSKFNLHTSILIRETGDYPEQLSTWGNPTEVLYVKGDSSLLSMRGVAVVGSRAATDEGRHRANKIAKTLSENSYCVNSGLALGIDTAAHTGALRAGGKTVAVIGTSLMEYYPKENSKLQDLISNLGAVVSQFSPLRKTQRLNFPLRNELMSAISIATVIVEASETSGALTQAKFCLKQNKKLFILQNQIDRTDLSWPREFLKKGAIALKSTDDLLQTLANVTSPDGPSNVQMKLL